MTTATTRDREDTSPASAAAGILVVEDDEDIRNSLEDILSEEGYAVRSAADGKAALDLLKAAGASGPHLIILDLIMPVMGGVAFMKVQKQDPALAAIPVLIMSADKEHTTEVAGSGAAKVIKKPPKLDELLSMVASLWRP